jgi:protein-S-isoprenylcysteine O-methyltransferase Ste14
LPPRFTLILLVAMLMIDWLAPAFVVLHAPLTYLGVVPLALGVLLNLVSAGIFRRRDTTINPFGESAVLVQDGFYRVSRNPMYLGMLLALLGVALLLGNLLALAALPVFVVFVTRRFILREEQALGAQFGKTYEEYCARVRRWI